MKYMIVKDDIAMAMAIGMLIAIMNKNRPSSQTPMDKSIIKVLLKFIFCSIYKKVQAYLMPNK